MRATYVRHGGSPLGLMPLASSCLSWQQNLSSQRASSPIPAVSLRPNSLGKQVIGGRAVVG